MPGRKSTKTVETPEHIMGADAWVTYIDPTMQDLNQFRNKTTAIQKRMSKVQDEGFSEKVSKLTEEAEVIQSEFLALYIKEWNWVADEAGEIPLDQPHNNPDVFRTLRPEELQWLGSLFNVTTEKKMISR